MGFYLSEIVCRNEIFAREFEKLNRINIAWKWSQERELDYSIRHQRPRKAQCGSDTDDNEKRTDDTEKGSKIS